MSYDKTKYFQGYGSYQYIEAGSTDASVLARLTQNRSYNYSWENIVTYTRQFDNHNFTLTGVTTWNHNQSENSYIQQTHIKENVYKWNNLDGTSTNTTATSSYTMSKGMGYVGRLNYSYDGKYLASFSIRHDGSSRLYHEKRWATFPAGSAGWRISEENFMAPTRRWLDNLKIRASYGVTGTAGINPYSSVQELESGTLLVGGMAQDIWKFS
ncbi:MAG: hypothetical protein LUD68_01590 [Rikenellaceae bacterium]|nr:hypothetical protein [Rikenellaceae bacterium]